MESIREGAKVVESPWLNIREAAAYLRRSTRSVNREVKARRLRAARVGGRRQLYFRQEWLDLYMEGRATPVDVR